MKEVKGYGVLNECKHTQKMCIYSNKIFKRYNENVHQTITRRSRLHISNYHMKRKKNTTKNDKYNK